MKVFAFLTEPASYTVDRNNAIYKSRGIEYCYLHSKSKAKTIIKEDNITFLDTIPFFRRYQFLKYTLATYDIIIINGYNSAFFIVLFILNLLYHKPIGIDSDTPYNEPHNLIRRWIKRLYLCLIFRTKYIYGLAGGSYVHKDLFRNYGMSENRIMLMPMVVDCNKFQAPIYFNKPLRPFRFLYVGRFVPCKNIEFLIKTFIKYHIENPSTELHLIGTGPLLNTLSNKYQSYHGIFFNGAKYNSELISFYHSCNVLILPSLYEPWGLVINEAMTAGLPVLVSTAVGARYDLVDKKNTGFVFDPTKPDTLLKCMRKISKINIYQEFSHNSWELVHNQWNYDLYRSCLDLFIKTAYDDSKNW